MSFHCLSANESSTARRSDAYRDGHRFLGGRRVSGGSTVRNRSRPIETDIARRDSTPGASTLFSIRF